MLCYESDDGSAAVGDTFSYSGFTYKILTEASGETSGTVQLGKCGTAISAGATIDIPSTVTRGDATYRVTAIGSDAFARVSGLVSLTIPEGVESIGSYAFLLTGLTSIVLPGSMRVIGGGAFSTCESLRSVTVPEGVTEIGNYAFLKCTALESLALPSTVTSMGTNVFSGCTSLTSMTIPAGVTAVGSQMFDSCTSLESVVIPEGVTTIGGYAFRGCSSLATLALPASLTSISAAAIQECTSLASITVAEGSESYASVDGVLFNHAMTEVVRCPCAKTGEFTIPDGVISVLGYAFQDCTGITSVTMPGTLVSIGESAFKNSGLTSLTIPDSVTEIKGSAFNGCMGITEVSIPASVKTFGDQVFNSCLSLMRIDVDPENTVLASVDGVLFLKGGLTLRCFPAGRADPYVVPITVKTVYRNSFDGCSKLTGVTISEGVESIEPYAFQNCTSLQSVTIPAVNTLGFNAFRGCTSPESVVLMDGFKNLSRYMFQGCTSLSSVDLPNTIESIDNYAFTDARHWHPWPCRTV